MDPITVAGAVVSIGSAIWGAIKGAKNNAEASKASQNEIDELKTIAQRVETPDFDINSLTPAQMDLVFSYNPEAIPFIQEVAPQLVEESGVAKGFLESQMGALNRFETLAETGEDAGLIAAREGAEREAMQTLSRAQAERDAVAQRRGIGLGSGASLALQQADIANTAERQQMMNEAAAADAALRRFQATQAGGSLAGQLYGQEMNRVASNADITNAFNARMGERRQNLASQNVTAQNQATLLREQEKQRISDLNKQQQYQNELQKRQLQQNDYQNKVTQAQLQMQPRKAALGNIEESAERTGRTIAGATKTGVAIGEAVGDIKTKPKTKPEEEV
jgi:hypothetical protein